MKQKLPNLELTRAPTRHPKLLENPLFFFFWHLQARGAWTAQKMRALTRDEPRVDSVLVKNTSRTRPRHCGYPRDVISPGQIRSEA